MSQYDSWAPWKMTLARLVTAQSQFVNAILLGFPDETISGRCGRACEKARPKLFAVALRDLLDLVFEFLFLEQEHCKNAIKHYEKFDERPELWRWYHDTRSGW